MTVKPFRIKGLLPLLTGVLLGFGLALGGAVLAGFTPAGLNASAAAGARGPAARPARR